MLVEVFIQNSLVLKLSYYHILYKKIITKTLKQLLQNIHFTKPIKKCLISLKQSSPLSLSHLWNCKKKKLYVTRPYYFFTYSGILILRVCVWGGGDQYSLLLLVTLVWYSQIQLRLNVFTNSPNFFALGLWCTSLLCYYISITFFQVQCLEGCLLKKKLILCSCLAYASVYTIFKCIMALDKFILHNTRSTEKDKG